MKTTPITQRGYTQRDHNKCHAGSSLLSISSAKIKSHSRGLLPGIPTTFTTQGGDPRQRHSGMTPNFSVPLPRALRGPARAAITPPGAREMSGFLPPWRGKAECVCTGMRGLSRGFTLIELLVVVLIIGILAAVALPQYNKAVKKAQGKEVLVAINALDKAMSAYALEHGNLNGPESAGNGNISVMAEDLPIQIPSLKHFKYNATWTGTSSDFRSAFQYGLYINKYSNLGEKLMEIEIHWDGITGQRLYARCTDGKECSNYFNCSYEQAETACHAPVSPCPSGASYTRNSCYLD